MATSFDNKCKILATILLDYEEYEGFTEMVEYHKVEMTLAGMVYSGLIKELSPMGLALIDNAWKSIDEITELPGKEWNDFDEVLDHLNAKYSGK